MQSYIIALILIFVSSGTSQDPPMAHSNTPISVWSQTNHGDNPVLPLAHFGTKSYYFGVTFTANFLDAYKTCVYHGMKLASISSDEENNFLQTQIKTFVGGSSTRFWTSGTRFKDGLIWMWLSTGQILTYSNWRKGEPNNMSHSEDCIDVGIEQEDALQWNNSKCSEEYNFICESVHKQPLPYDE